MLESLFNKVEKETSTRVNIAKFFNSKPLVASAVFSLNQKQCGMVSTKNGRFGLVRIICTLLVETISTRFFLINLQKPKTCPK